MLVSKLLAQSASSSLVNESGTHNAGGSPGVAGVDGNVNPFGITPIISYCRSFSRTRPDDARICGIMASPVSVAEDNNICGAREFFLSRERSSDQRRNAQRGEETGCGPAAGDMLRFILARDIEALALVTREN